MADGEQQAPKHAQALGARPVEVLREALGLQAGFGGSRPLRPLARSARRLMIRKPAITPLSALPLGRPAVT
jgi:hypothetical protein